jgi:formylglycine-generating enzyme required for sulfatase activity
VEVNVGTEQKLAAGDRLITNSIGMKLTLIPTGEFMMGSGESAEETAKFFNKTYGVSDLTADHFKDEHPQHRVRIAIPFYLGTCHVTRGQFRQFVADAGYKTDAEKGKRPGHGAGIMTRRSASSTRHIPGGARVSSRPTSTPRST